MKFGLKLPLDLSTISFALGFNSRPAMSFSLSSLSLPLSPPLFLCFMSFYGKATLALLSWLLAMVGRSEWAEMDEVNDSLWTLLEFPLKRPQPHSVRKPCAPVSYKCPAKPFISVSSQTYTFEDEKEPFSSKDEIMFICKYNKPALQFKAAWRTFDGWMNHLWYFKSR